MPITSGVEVEGVIAGSPAEQAGLIQNDIIVQADGETVADTVKLIGIISAKQSGQSVELVIFRGSQKINKTVPVALHAGIIPPLFK